MEEARTELPGLRYLVRVRLVAFQDWSTPSALPGLDHDDGGDGDGDGGDGDAGDDFPEPPPGRDVDDDYSGHHDSKDEDSDDSNHNRRHPGMDRQYRRRSFSPPSVHSATPSVMVGTVNCPLEEGRLAAGFHRDELVGPGPGTESPGPDACCARAWAWVAPVTNHAPLRRGLHLLVSGHLKGCLVLRGWVHEWPRRGSLARRRLTCRWLGAREPRILESWAASS